MKAIINRWDIILLGVLIFTYAFILSYFSILRHNAFASNFDLANMDQTIWDTLHGHFFSLTGPDGTISRFSIHADLILVLLTPLYLIWDNVRILLIFQSLTLALGAIPTYFLSIKILKNRVLSLILAFVYLLNPGMQWTNIYDFHGVSLAIPFLISAFYFAYTKKWKLFALFVFLSLLTKEEISLDLMMMGFIIAVMFREWRIGIMTSILSVSWGLLMVFVAIPHFSPDNLHWAFNSLYYFHYDKGILKYIPWPSDVFGYFFTNPNSLNYYNLLLRPFTYIPILGFPYVLISLPELALNIMSKDSAMSSIHFHYVSGIVPSLVIGTIFALSYITWIFSKLKITKKYKQILLYLLAVVLLVVSVRFDYHYSPLPFSPSCWCLIYNVEPDDIAFERVLQTIPPQASVAASGNIRPHVTHRIDAFNLPSKALSADFIAILDQNRIIGNYNREDFDYNLAKKLQSSIDYTLISHIGHFYLFKKKGLKNYDSR